MSLNIFYKFALIGSILILQVPLAAELIVVQGKRGAWLEGKISDYQLTIDCTSNWGSQGLANFMLGPPTDKPDPNLKGISSFRYKFDIDTPIELDDDVSSDWLTTDANEFNDRIFWDLPITDALFQQFSYANSLTINFKSNTGEQNYKLIMGRPEGLLVGPTGSAWNSFHSICMERRK